MTQIYFTKAEAALYLRVSQSTIDRWVADGRLRRHKIDGIRSVRFIRSELDELVVPDEDTEAGASLATNTRS
jgi:excisionase family DNA binding protein